MLVGRRRRVEMRAGELAMSHWRGRIAPGRRSSALRLAKPAPGPTTSHLSTLLPANHASSPQQGTVRSVFHPFSVLNASTRPPCC